MKNRRELFVYSEFTFCCCYVLPRRVTCRVYMQVTRFLNRYGAGLYLYICVYTERWFSFISVFFNVRANKHMETLVLKGAHTYD